MLPPFLTNSERDPTRFGSAQPRLESAIPPARDRGLDLRRAESPGNHRPKPAASGHARSIECAESDARSIRPLGTHRLLERTQAASHGVLHPTTLAEAGSDQHRVCLTRLCCAFRLSQPLDALFRLQPLRPCFMPVTPLGFCFQRFSLPGSGLVSRRVLPSMPFSMIGSGVCQDDSSPDPDFEGLRTRGIRTVRPELPGTWRPILS
jgi:hypothetical protein